MKRSLLLVITCALVALGAGPKAPLGDRIDPVRVDADARFEVVDVFITAGEQALGAYQVLLTGVETDDEDAGATVRIVGLEGGAHPAFSAPPFYDPAALMNNEVIIAAFNTGKDLPVGRTRVARVHVMLEGEGEPQYELKLEAAAGAGGANIKNARATIERVTREPIEGTDS